MFEHLFESLFRRNIFEYHFDGWMFFGKILLMCKFGDVLTIEEELELLFDLFKMIGDLFD